MQFIRDIRASDMQTKKRWLFILSAVCITLVFLLWLISFKNILRAIESPEIEVNDALPEESFTDRFKAALQELGGVISTSAENLKKAVSKDPIILTPSASTTNQ